MKIGYPPPGRECSKILPAVLFLVFLVLAFVYRFVPDLDRDILIAHNGIFQQPVLYGFFAFITDAGIPVIMIIYSFLILFYLRSGNNNDNILIFLAVMLSLFIAGAAGDILKLIIGRERPVVELSGLIASERTFKTLSFPSGHTTKVMAMTLPLIFMEGRRIRFFDLTRWLVLFIAIMVAYSRIALQVHYPSDVMGGIAVAFLFLPLSCMAGVRVMEFAERRGRVEQAGILISGFFFITGIIVLVL